MRTRVLLVAAVLTATTLSGCGNDDRRSPSSRSPSSRSPSSRSPSSLRCCPTGKSVLDLEDGKEYASPAGFAPELRLTIPGQGWVSTHRGADGFDVGQPVPDVDAAMLVVAFLTAPEATSDEALQAIVGRAEDAGAEVEGVPSKTIHVTGGDGPLVTSSEAGIALDAVPDGYSTIEATDTEGGTLLKVTWVPDAANRAEADQLAAALLGQVTQS